MNDNRPRTTGTGFSLIELMVVVAILSVFAAISVPKYIKYRSKVRQQECQKGLTAIYEAEKRYLEEHGRYTDDLTALNWHPKDSPRCLYGFKTGPSEDKNDTQDKAVINQCEGAPCYNTDRMNLSENTPIESEDLPDNTTASIDGFLAGCVGNLDTDPTLDNSTIDQNGKISQIINDVSY